MSLLFNVTTPSKQLDVSFPRSIKRVPICCGRLPASRGVPPCSSSCVSSYPHATLCPFNCNLACADFHCDGPALDGGAFGGGREVAIYIRMAGAKTISNCRIIRLCVQSHFTAISHPMGRLGNFGGMLVGTNRAIAISFSVNRSVLQCCGVGVSCIDSPNRFRIFMKGSDDIARCTIFCLRSRCSGGKWKGTLLSRGLARRKMFL